MTVSWSGAGYLQADFALSLTPEVDAFRIVPASSGGAFTGDYYADVPGFASWTFSFQAGDVLPSGLNVLFDAGGTVFQRSVLSQVSTMDQWTTITVPLDYAGWFGGSSVAFSNGLSSVNYIDIQIVRNGSAAQSYQLDNFELNEESHAAVPEPMTLSFLLAPLAYLLAKRRTRLRRNGPIGALGLLLLGALTLGPRSSGAAGPWTETFAGGAAGWTNIGAGQCVASNAEILVTFAQQFGPPSPETVRFAADSTASGGAFAGNHLAAETMFVGFRFYASNALPAKLDIVWEDGTNSYDKALGGYVTETGRWYAFVVHLADKAGGPWVGPGDDASYRGGLTNVQRVAIEVRRSSSAAQQFRLDDVFVAPAPRASAAVRSGAQVQTAWGPLPTGARCTFEAADSVTGAWLPIASRAATNALEVLTEDLSASGCQRLKIETD